MKFIAKYFRKNSQPKKSANANLDHIEDILEMVDNNQPSADQPQPSAEKPRLAFLPFQSKKA
jgi:hypothetical protein